MKKRLLILNTNFPPNNSIGTQRIIRISKYLDKSDWQLFVLTLKEDYFPARQTPGGDAKITALLDSMTIYRTGKFDLVGTLLKIRDALRGRRKRGAASNRATSSPPSPGSAAKSSPRGRFAWLKKMISTVSDLLEFPDKDVTMLPFAVLRGWRIIRKHKIDLIYTSSPPHSLHLSGALLKKITGARLVVDFRDPWARSPWHDEIRVSSKMERRKHRWIQKLERWVVESADRVVFVSQQMCDDFIAFYADLPADKFRVFYNGYDPDNILPADHRVPDRQARQTAPVTIVHTGTLYKRRDPMPLVQALHQLITEKPHLKNRVKLKFIGGITEELAHIPNRVKELQLEDMVEFLPQVSYRESFRCMMEGDILMLLQPVTRLQIPGKFYDYICFEKPILAIGEKESAVESLVKDKFGFFADYSDAEDLKKTLCQLAENPKMQVEGIRRRREFFNMAKSIKTFESILQSALIDP